MRVRRIIAPVILTLAAFGAVAAPVAASAAPALAAVTHVTPQGHYYGAAPRGHYYG